MYRAEQLENAIKKEEKSGTPCVKRASTLEQTSRITPEQRAIITETFRMMEEDGRRNGLNIFVRLFSEYPNYKDIWPQFQAITDSSLMGAKELHKHADVYMHGLHNIIESIDDDHTLAEQLRKIAQAHLKWGIRKFHIQNMLPEVLSVLSMCSGGMTPEIQDAWTTLYTVIAALVEEYRLEGEHEQNYRKGHGGHK